MYTFTEWFKRLVLPHMKRLPGTKVLLGDNLKSHFSYDMLKMCEDNDINFICLPPNATHLAQPLDVAVFRPLKRVWSSIVLEFKKTNPKDTCANKVMFPGLLKKLIQDPKLKEVFTLTLRVDLQQQESILQHSNHYSKGLTVVVHPQVQCCLQKREPRHLILPSQNIFAATGSQGKVQVGLQPKGSMDPSLNQEKQFRHHHALLVREAFQYQYPQAVTVMWKNPHQQVKLHPRDQRRVLQMSHCLFLILCW